MSWRAYKAALDPELITHRIVFNPNYGGKGTTVPGACAVPIRQRGIKPETRAAIRESVRYEGFRNPIVVYRTGGQLLLSFGGGRLQAAKELVCLIPAIVIDYDGDVHDFEEVTPSNWREFFMDVPSNAYWDETGFHMHYGLERNRNNEFDPAGVAWITNDEDRATIIEESPWLADDV